MKLSVIIPVYNEQGTIAETIARVRASSPEKEIIVVDDASTDSTCDIVLIQDADLEYDPADYPALIAPIIAGQADVVYGTRAPGFRGMSWRHRLFNWIAARLTNLLFRANLTDEATCYKVFRTEVLRSIPLTCRRFEFCPEVTAKVRRRGLPIHEVPVSYQARDIGAGKKIRWWDGVVALWTLIKYRFTD